MDQEFEVDPDLDLDPAFSRPSNLAGESLGALGMEMGMGMGMGVGLGDELNQELDHQGLIGEGERMHSSTISNFDSDLNQPNRLEALGGSLADELASATTSAAQRRQDRRRMRDEYGLEIDDDEDQDGEEEGEAGEEMEHELQKANEREEEGVEEDEQDEDQKPSSKSRQRRRRDPTSTSPLNSNSNSNSNSNPLPPPPLSNALHDDPRASPSNRRPRASNDATTREESQLLKDERLASENEDIYNQNSSSLIDSLRTNDSFLKKLKALDGKIDASASTSTSTQGGGGEMEHDSSKLEKASKEVLKLMQDHLERREHQLREWREVELNFKRIEGENGGGLAGLRAAGGILNSLLNQEDGESLEREQEKEKEKEEQKRSDLDLVQEMDEEEENQENQEIETARDEEGGEETEESNRKSSRRRRGGGGGGGGSSKSIPSNTTSIPALDFPPLPASTEPTFQQLNHLISLNSSLVSSLSHLHDQVQVQRSGISQIGKKLRNLKSVFNQWKTEWEGVEKSRRWIEEWESTSEKLDSNPTSNHQNSNSDPNSNSSLTSKDQSEFNFIRKPENIQAWTGQQLTRFEKILNDSEIQARKLLLPNQDENRNASGQWDDAIEELERKGRLMLQKDERVSQCWNLG